MKFLMGQINTTPCDFEGNLKQILDGIKEAGDGDCKLVIFPELSIPGYLCQDLMYDVDFIDQNNESIYAIREASKEFPDLRIVVGCIDRNTKGVGKPFKNVAIVIRNNYVIAQYTKQLLPFYDVFDEGRYFESGNETTVFRIDGRTFGLTICEDIWNDKEQKEHNYIGNPINQYANLDIDCLINISSSPYSQGKPFLRHKMLRRVSKKFPDGIIYVNQVGGQDELVFDGRSSYVKANQFQGSTLMDEHYVLYNGADSNPSYKVLEFDRDKSEVEGSSSARQRQEFLKEMLVMGLRDYIEKCGFKQVVIGSSGGIDSALVICLAAEAIGPENVHCIMMPSVHSSDHSLSDAQALHKAVGCPEYKMPVAHTQLVEDLGEKFNAGDDYYKVADENIQARMRGSYVMWFSNALGALTLTTGNKSELAIGYATLYGDMCGGYAPICDLYKTQVFDIARSFYKDFIPENILTKEPSAELAEGQFDSNELPDYDRLDVLIRAYVENNIHTIKSFKRWCEKNVSGEAPEFELEEYSRMILKIDQNEFKRRQYAPGTKLSKKAFGIGRRIPLAKGKKSWTLES
jgi:NAD+ synthetase